MKKGVYLVFIIAFAVCSFTMAWFNYTYFNNINLNKEKMSDYNWALEMTSDYDYIYFDEEKGFYVEKDFKEISLNIQGVNLSKNTDKDSYEIIEVNDSETYAVKYNGKKIYTAKNNGELFQIEDNIFEERYSLSSNIVDVKTGKKLGSLQNCYWVSSIGNGYYCANSSVSIGNTECYKLLNDNFQLADKSIYTRIGNYAEGLSLVTKYKTGSYSKLPSNTPSLITEYIDKDLKPVITIQGELYANRFREGKAIIYYQDKVICIDKTGKELYSIKLKKDLDKKIMEPDNDKQECITNSTYYKGSVAIYDGEKMGIVDKSGNWIVDPIYDNVESIKNNLYKVTDGNKKGILDGNGNKLIDTIFSTIYVEANEYAIVKSGKKVGIIKLEVGEDSVK